MKRLIEALDSTPVWIAVFVCSVLFVFTYAFVVNRDAVSRNAETIRAQQEQLVHLCETIRVIDAVIVQRGVVSADALGSGDLPDWARNYLLASNEIFETAHQDLSESRACRRIE